jgi:hypothetical protein
MKKSTIILLQTIIMVLGLGVLALLIIEPRVEGVNANATNLQMYTDPFIILVYAGAIPFFFALSEAVKLLGYIGKNKLFSLDGVKALQKIKYSAITIIGFVFVEEFLIMLNHGSDDATGGIFIGLLIVALSGIVAIVSGMFEKILQNAVDMKSENDLTV